MDSFFKGNGFTTLDQTDFQKGEITFRNAWGVCDGDLYNRTLREAGAAWDRHKPFCFVVMTTSNHRPFTYPPFPGGVTAKARHGAVRYADYAIGEFLDKARTTPWFDDTIFVVVADHCAGSAGKMAVAVDTHHIPMLIYGPKLVSPLRSDTLASQIDLAPTLAGLLNFSYDSNFYGRDLLRPGIGHAPMGNYEKIGLLSQDKFCLLLPKQTSLAYLVPSLGTQTPSRVDQGLLQDTISYYQTASYLLKNHRQAIQADAVGATTAPATQSASVPSDSARR